MKCIPSIFYSIAAGFIISTTAIFPPYFLVNVKADTFMVSASVCRKSPAFAGLFRQTEAPSSEGAYHFFTGTGFANYGKQFPICCDACPEITLVSLSAYNSVVCLFNFVLR